MDTLKSNDRMRDPSGNSSQYADFFSSTLRREEVIETTAPNSEEHELALKSQYVVTSKDLVLHMYGAGYSLESIKKEIVVRSNLMASVTELARTSGVSDYEGLYALDNTWRASAAFTSMALMLVENEPYLGVLRGLLSPAPAERTYLMDTLIGAFVPQYAPAKKYKVDKYSAVWMDPVLRVLAGPPETRAHGLAVHMKSWCRIMRPWGWKPDLNTEPGKDRLFCDFAFEIALAVCAYDIDDSSFRDHPYYPRDLVDYYRANVRRTRDAWRSEGGGNGMPVVAPPPPPKADLARSKRKAIARWIELVCDGDNDAIESVLEIVGKPRKLDDIGALMDALSEHNQGIHADIKDDETTLIQAARLAEARNLGDFEGPPGPPFGPARCTAGLLALSEWLQTRGYRLVDLDNDDDAWHAVVVKAEYLAELLELSSSLKLRVREPGTVYND